MHDAQAAAILVRMAIALVFAVPTAIFATRKNRSGIGWGIFGFFLGPIPLLILAFCSYVCPKCHLNLTNDQWRSKICPNCARNEQRHSEALSEM